FQAEDGIRDRNVTGVQTCALPICRFFKYSGTFWPARSSGRTRLTTYPARGTSNLTNSSAALRVSRMIISSGTTTKKKAVLTLSRSEERRVGKEARWR